MTLPRIPLRDMPGNGESLGEGSRIHQNKPWSGDPAFVAWLESDEAAQFMCLDVPVVWAAWQASRADIRRQGLELLHHIDLVAYRDAAHLRLSDAVPHVANFRNILARTGGRS